MNFVQDEKVDLSIADYKVSSYVFHLEPAELLRLHTYVLGHNYPCQAGTVFVGCRVLVDEESLPDFGAALKLLGIKIRSEEKVP